MWTIRLTLFFDMVFFFDFLQSFVDWEKIGKQPNKDNYDTDYNNVNFSAATKAICHFYAIILCK